jgi:uncharacterized protein (DUF2384 family)
LRVRRIELIVRFAGGREYLRLVYGLEKTPRALHTSRSASWPADTVRKRKNAPGLQDGLGHLALIYSDLIAVHAGDRTAAMRWLNTPNRALKDRERPRTLLERGQLDVLEALVDSLKRRQQL